MVQISPTEQISLILDLIAHSTVATINHYYFFHNNHLANYYTWVRENKDCWTYANIALP